MLYDLLNIRLNGEDKNYLNLKGTEVFMNKEFLRLGKCLRLDTVGGTLKTAPITSIKRNRKNGILKIDVENGYTFYLKSQMEVVEVERKPFYVVKGGVA